MSNKYAFGSGRQRKRDTTPSSSTHQASTTWKDPSTTSSRTPQLGSESASWASASAATGAAATMCLICLAIACKCSRSRRK